MGFKGTYRGFLLWFDSNCNQLGITRNSLRMRVNYYSTSYGHSQRSNIAYLLLSLLLSSLHSPLIISHLSSLPQWTMTTCYAAGLWIDVESWIVESVMRRMESISDRERNRKNVNYGVNESPCGRTTCVYLSVVGWYVDDHWRSLSHCCWSSLFLFTRELTEKVEIQTEESGGGAEDKEEERVDGRNKVEFGAVSVAVRAVNKVHHPPSHWSQSVSVGQG